MKEKNIEIVMNGLTRQYGYFLENIRSVDSNSELWTVCKEISGVQYRLIFLNSQSIDKLKHHHIPEDKNNIYILFSDDELSLEKDNQALSMNNLSEKPTIRVELKDKKVNYSQNVNLQVVQEIASVMSNNNLKSSKEKINLEDKPWITIGIISINVIMYIITAYLSFVYAKGSLFTSDINVLIFLGAKVNALIQEGSVLQAYFLYVFTWWNCACSC